ncbi:DUF6879 family protein [Nocardia callitridis]|uniref:DUF6879 domain-containing protein n=1 Tax=Nocardia callitridis TaxID=648753 RepID=A0ABP9JYP1_9NOCA
MELLTDQQWDDLHASATRSAVHLELRDVYVVPDEVERVDRWRAGLLTDEEDAQWWQPWVDMTRRQTARGVQMRRARIVSEPVSDYIHYEWATTRNTDGGEQVRWLPRHLTTGLALTVVDYWLFDDATVVFNHFAGSGVWIGNEVSTDPATAELCRKSFEAVWSLAVPHGEYKPILA